MAVTMVIIVFCGVILGQMVTNVSEEHASSIIRVEAQPKLVTFIP
jgi:hypothetical protein